MAIQRSPKNAKALNPGQLGSEDSMFQYTSDQSASSDAPPPATLRTDTFITIELNQYDSSIDNIWSDSDGPQSHGESSAPPPSDANGNIWAIQSAQPSWRNIFASGSAINQDQSWPSEPSSQSAVNNVWSQGHSASGFMAKPPISNLNVINEDAILREKVPPPSRLRA
ncbi:hypothetical protein LEN26_000274 [Aphanomyces euteiches]|nr:hypothetical protein AeMF1_019084 [Aphanomyces euteiches]KAH9163915.1 hypothetical protein LEN26_000274 [Aphanomyces euteiches]